MSTRVAADFSENLSRGKSEEIRVDIHDNQHRGSALDWKEMSTTVSGKWVRSISHVDYSGVVTWPRGDGSPGLQPS